MNRRYVTTFCLLASSTVARVANERPDDANGDLISKFPTLNQAAGLSATSDPFDSRLESERALDFLRIPIGFRLGSGCVLAGSEQTSMGPDGSQ